MPFIPFIKEAPRDYISTQEAVLDKFPSLEKVAFNWGDFKSGIQDEGIPLSGAALGAGIGLKYNKPLVGAALGYAAGGGASLLRSYLKHEEPSDTRRLLAAGALGYGIGGLTHTGVGRLAGNTNLGQRFFRASEHVPGTFLHGFTEEAFPAVGATLATGISQGMKKTPNGRNQEP